MESTMAFVVGGGLTLLILGFLLASAQSQIQGFDASRLNIVMIVGGMLMVTGIVGWLFLARPWQYFDDWSTPAYTGHDEAHHGESDAVHAEAPEDVAELGLTEEVVRHDKRTGAAVYTVTASVRDDLRKIEGIGPKIATTLNAVGITTYADLAARQPQDVERIVRDAGGRMVGHADAWVEQAKLAALGKWPELDAYKNTLRSKPKR
jgi:predicted flap endonuclease-1-like 5' DNA nuclease